MNKPVQINMYYSDSLAVAISLIWFTDSKLQKGFQSWRNLQQPALPSRLSVPAVLQCCTLDQHHHITHAASCRRCGGRL